MNRLTVHDYLAWATDELEEAQCESPHQDASVLVREVIGLSDGEWLSAQGRVLSVEEQDAVSAAVMRRRKREPLEYIVGHMDFDGLRLKLDKRTLVPDPASVALVTLAGTFEPGSRVHEVGTGCGAIALAIKSRYRGLTVSGTDISHEAVEAAQENASALGLSVQFWPWSNMPTGDYDLVIANLPYVDRQQSALPIPPEYTVHQPEVAVYSVDGSDALSNIRAFVESAQWTTATVALQHAPSQVEAVAEFFVDPQVIESDARYARFTYGKLRKR